MEATIVWGLVQASYYGIEGMRVLEVLGVLGLREAVRAGSLGGALQI